MKILLLKTSLFFAMLANLCFANQTQPDNKNTQTLAKNDDTKIQSLQLLPKNYASASKSSFGINARVGFLGLELEANIIDYGNYAHIIYDYHDYIFSPGLSLYYSYMTNGIGIEAMLEWEYNMHLTSYSKIYNFFTPAIYFQWVEGNTISSIGIGYDIGLQDSITYKNFAITYMPHGIAFLLKKQLQINKNHATGLFCKAGIRWLNINISDKAQQASLNSYNYVIFEFGLNYRFNLGF